MVVLVERTTDRETKYNRVPIVGVTPSGMSLPGSIHGSGAAPQVRVLAHREWGVIQQVHSVSQVTEFYPLAPLTTQRDFALLPTLAPR